MKKETIRIVCIFALLAAIMVMVTPAAAWWDSDWQYKRPITINTTSSLINYPVNVNITYDSDMQPDFADIRFTNEEEDTELDYWIESKSDGEWCSVWIKVDSIDTNNGTQAYMYYANSFATSTSNATNVFLLYDDFLGTSLDTEKWEEHTFGDWDSPTRVYLSDGKVVFDSLCPYNNDPAWIQSTQIFEYPVIVEVKFLDILIGEHSSYGDAGLGENTSSGEKYLARGKHYKQVAIIGENASSSWVVDQKPESDLNHSLPNAIWSFAWAEGKQIFNINNCRELEGSDTKNTIGDYYICFGKFGTSQTTTTADWVRVRKYADPEPDVSVGGEEAINVVYLEPAKSSASFCEETTVQVYANTTGFAGLFQGGQFNLTYDPTCANVTNVVFNPVWNDTFTTWWDTYTNGYTRVGFGVDTPAEMVNGSVWICNLTIHCVCETNCSTTLNFATTTELVNDFGAEVKAHWLGGTFNSTAAPPPPPASIINLTNVTGNFWINWTWDNPSDADFNYTMVYINGTFETNTSNEHFNLTNLSPHATKTISTHTVDTSENINETWVNQTTTIPNNDPVLDSIGNKTVDEGQTVTIDVNATDFDGDKLTYYCNRTDLFADFNCTTGIGSWTPPSVQAGTYYVDFGAADGYGGMDNETIRIIVLDKTPPASISNLSYTNGTTWINWTWTDPADADFNYTMLYLNGTWQTNTSYPFYNATALDPDTCYGVGTHTVDTSGNVNETWVNQTAKAQAENISPLASFTCSPEPPFHLYQMITFNASSSYDPDGFITNYEWDFGDGNITSTTEEVIKHSYSSTGDYNVTLTVTDDDGATNTTSMTIAVTERLVFDTGEGTYPSIFGTHKGKINPDEDIVVRKMYTYPCTGTGGHAEYVKIWNSTLNVSASWNGYKGDWHNISFSKSFILKAGETYYYEIITGSYPQIIHASSKEVTGGTITCDKFIDANGRIYNDWIPAIKFFW